MNKKQEKTFIKILYQRY